MKTVTPSLLFLTLISSSIYGQGWYAEIDLELNHSLYAYESISNATLTFSGVTVSGTSTNSNLHLIVTGTGPVSGEISASVAGAAWGPYDSNDPYHQSLPSLRFTGKHDVPCNTGFFEKAGDLEWHELYIWVKLYPRLQIADFILLCEEVTLITNTCSPIYRWEVSDSPAGNFKTLPGKSTSSISVNRQELVDIGFANPYGRKYFRVTGPPNTTSQLQPIDIFYPGPAASIRVTPPTCHNGDDGSVALDIQSPFPGVINDYVITLFKGLPPSGQTEQDYINDGAHKTFSGLSAGNYWVRIENNTNKDVYGNCWTDYAVGTLENPKPVTLTTTVSNYNGYGVRCSGSNDGRIQVMPSGGSGAYSTFEWTPAVSTTAVATDLTAGTFQVKVTDTRGCESETVINTITQPDPLSVQLFSGGGKNGYDVSCHDKTDGMVEASVSGGVPVYAYLWSDRNVTPWINGVSAGDYSVTVRDANGCTAGASISLNAPRPIDFNIEEINPISCPGDATGSLEVVSITNSIGQVYHSWSSGEREAVVFNKSSGIYTATVSDDQGCQTTKTYELPEPALHTAEIVAASNYNGAAIRCNGTASGELRATLRDHSGAIATAQEYTWFRNGILHESGPDFETLQEADAASYRVKLRYAEHCTTEAVYLLQEPDPVDIAINIISDYNGVAISCSGKADGSISAAGSGGTGALSLQWNTGETASLLTGLAAGSYTVTATDVNGCSAQVETALTAPEPVQTTIETLSDFNGASISCSEASDGRLRATAKGGVFPYTFGWSNGVAGADLTNAGAGRYAVTATDANGCVGQAQSAIIAPLPLSAAIVDSSNYNGYGTTCAGMADGFLVAGATGGTGTYRYRWLGTKETTATRSDLHKGIYTVEIHDANGCSATAQGSITEPAPVLITTVNLRNASCYEGSDGEIELEVVGGTGAYTYSVGGELWQAQPRLGNLRAGMHSARARDSNGCTITSTQTLLQPEAISIAFTNISPALCGDPRGSIAATVRGGTDGYLYQWVDANARTVSTNATASQLSAGIYSLTVTDGHGCKASNVAGVTSSDGPETTVADIKSATCSYTADGSAKIEVIRGDGPFSFFWDNGHNTSEAVDLRKGSYLVRITDINQCTTIESVEIPAPDSLTIKLVEQKEPRCFGGCDGEISTMAEGGTGSYQYDWGSSSGPVVTDLCAGEYVLTVTDHNKCVARQTFVLTQPDLMTVTQGFLQSPSCPESCDGELALEATGGTGVLQFMWTNGSTGAALGDLCPGEFTVVVKDSRNCSITETFKLAAPDIIPPRLGGSVTLCEGQTYLLDAGPDWKQYAWSGSNGFKDDARTITISEAGTYWLKATSAQGCVARDTFLLQTSSDLLQANFLIPTQAFAGDTVVMIDISWPVPDDVTWNFPQDITLLESTADNVYAAFDAPGIYEVSLSARLGACRDELTKSITILQEEEHVAEEGRLGREDLLKEFALYPNPNDGMFDVVVHMTKESPIVLTVWNILTSTQIVQIQRSGRSFYQEHFDLRPLSAGAYSLRLDAADETRFIRFIVK